MASAASSLTSSTRSLAVDARAPLQSTIAPPQCVSLPTIPQPRSSSSSSSSAWKSPVAYCRKIARNVAAMAAGEAPAASATSEASVEVVETTTEVPVETVETTAELPDIVKTVQQAWDKVEDKYAVSSLGAAAVVFLCGSAGAISAIDRLPLVPGALELVGIGYTGWFAYKNLIYKPDRQALVKKIKDLYADVTGSS